MNDVSNNNKLRALITDDVHPLLIEGLEKNNYKVDFFPEISLDETRSMLDQYHGLVINSKIKADAEFLKKGKNLKWIGRLGSGMEIIDQDCAAKLGIKLINTPEANCQAVAEHALGMILCLFRNLLRADDQVRKNIWNREQNRGEELDGKTVGIIGFGHTGPAFAHLLEGFNVKILIFDKYRQLLEFKHRYEVVNDLRQLQASADLISLHLPLTPETKHLVDMTFIDSCRNSFYLINTSRGPVVNTVHLIEALRSGKIKGACLDVFENEQPERYNFEESAVYKELHNFDQVVLSPHIAGWTHQSKRKIAGQMLKKLMDLDLEEVI